VFSRSELRRSIVEASRIDHYEESRKRVTRWSLCRKCGEFTPTYQMEVDHIRSIVPLDKNLEDMSWDEVVNNIWCDKENLDALCKMCHNKKSSEERKERNRIKKERNKKNG